MANNVDPDQMPQNVASDLGLHCLLKPLCLNTYGKFGTDFYFLIFIIFHKKTYIMGILMSSNEVRKCKVHQ